MLIYLYSKNLGFKGGGAKSSLVIKKYLNKIGHDCISISKVCALKQLICKRKPDLILHHNILDMYSILKISKKFKVPIIIKVNGLITCSKGTHYKENKSGFGIRCLKCSLFGMFMCGIKKRTGYKLGIFNMIKLAISSPIRFFNMKLRLYCLNKANGVIAIGSTLKKILIKNGVKNKIFVCPQPIDNNFMKKNKVGKANNLNNKEFNIDWKVINHFNKSKKKKIIFATGLHAEKGILVLLKALNELNRDDTELYIIGKKYDYVNFSVYKKLVGQNVYFTGKVPLNFMKNFYNKAHFLAHLSLLYEPFGRVWAEALLWKCPVLAFKDRGSPYDYLAGGKQAYLCEPNMKSLKRAITVLLDDKKWRNKLAKNGFKFAKRNLIGSVVVKKLIKIYNEVI